MPIYDYFCDECGMFREMRPMVDSSQSCPCPDCQRLAKRMITAPHVRTARSSTLVKKEEFNQRSANEPHVIKRINSSPDQPSQNATASHSKHTYGQPGHRPWMVGH